jgi:hypothetical protein
MLTKRDLEQIAVVIDKSVNTAVFKAFEGVWDIHLCPELQSLHDGIDDILLKMDRYAYKMDLDRIGKRMDSLEDKFEIKNKRHARH